MGVGSAVTVINRVLDGALYRVGPFPASDACTAGSVRFARSVQWTSHVADKLWSTRGKPVGRKCSKRSAPTRQDDRRRLPTRRLQSERDNGEYTQLVDKKHDNAEAAPELRPARRDLRRTSTVRLTPSYHSVKTETFGRNRFSASTIAVAAVESASDRRRYSTRFQVCSLQSIQTQPLTSSVVASTSTNSES